MPDVLQRTREFITENYLYMRPNAQLADEDRLLEKGIIDSMGVVELVEFLEQEFSVEVGGCVEDACHFVSRDV